jgi:hypothetical protein
LTSEILTRTGCLVIRHARLRELSPGVRSQPPPQHPGTRRYAAVVTSERVPHELLGHAQVAEHLSRRRSAEVEQAEIIFKPGDLVAITSPLPSTSSSTAKHSSPSAGCKASGANPLTASHGTGFARSRGPLRLLLRPFSAEAAHRFRMKTRLILDRWCAPNRWFDGHNRPSDGRSVLSIVNGAERMTLPLGIPSSRDPKRSWATTRTGVRYHPDWCG